MIKHIKNLGLYEKNIILVFFGSSLASFFNLLYQLLIAHRLSPVDFASFNTLLSIFIVISTPLGAVQATITKYIAEFNTAGKIDKVKSLLSYIFSKALLFAVIMFVISYFASGYILDKLKIYYVTSGYILAVLLALCWVMPVLAGGIQGLELFKWYSSSAITSSLLKLLLAAIFLQVGFGFNGALSAYLIAILAGALISYIPLKPYLSFSAESKKISNEKLFLYIFPLAVSLFCFTVLITSDMLLVKYFFTPDESGVYSLAQMLGKVILFLPGSISLVMFPRTSGLSAQNQDARSTVKKSLLYAVILCFLASLFYNIFPVQVLKILTGKALAETIYLGRFFSVSMIFFALVYILVIYFLSIKDFRFIKFLALFAVLQCIAIILFHRSLVQVQFILCVNSIALFLVHILLIGRDGSEATTKVSRLPGALASL